MVNMKCERCGSSIAISTTGFVTLGCRVCGGSRIEFDKDVVRRSALDGYEEKVKAETKVDASRNRSYLWKVTELSSPKTSTSDKPKRKRVKRVRK